MHKTALPFEFSLKPVPLLDQVHGALRVCVITASRQLCRAFACRRGSDIRTVQELFDHKNVETTMIYTHVINQGGLPVRSPADNL